MQKLIIEKKHRILVSLLLFYIKNTIIWLLLPHPSKKEWNILKLYLRKTKVEKSKTLFVGKSPFLSKIKAPFYMTLSWRVYAIPRVLLWYESQPLIPNSSFKVQTIDLRCNPYNALFIIITSKCYRGKNGPGVMRKTQRTNVTNRSHARCG